MTWRDPIGAAFLVAAGIGGGLAISVPAAIALGVTGAALGAAVALARIRWAVAIPVIIGTTAGAVLGWALTHAFCRPAGCPVGETVAASLSGIGSLVGVGLVVALAVRSFDEYRQNVGANRPPQAPPPSKD